MPDIQFERPLKDCVSWVGQRQSGKSVGMINFILHNPNPMIIFDTLSVISNKRLALPPNVKIINPHWSEKTLPSYEERLEVFLPICDQIWRRGNVIFTVEEWHLFCKTKFALPAPFANLFNQGGNRNIAVWGTSQRAAQVHNDILAACTHHFIYSLSMPQDVRYMSDYVSKSLIEGDPKNPNRLCVVNMPEYHFLYYNCHTRKAEFYQPLTLY